MTNPANTTNPSSEKLISEMTHAELGAMEFDAIPFEWEMTPKLWMDYARTDGFTFTCCHAFCKLTKQEALAKVRAEPEMMGNLWQQIDEYQERNAKTQDILTAAHARLMICLSQVLADEEEAA